MTRCRIYFTFCWDYTHLVGNYDNFPIRVRCSNDWSLNIYQPPIVEDRPYLMEKPRNHVGRYVSPRQCNKPSEVIEDHD